MFDRNAVRISIRLVFEDIILKDGVIGTIPVVPHSFSLSVPALGKTHFKLDLAILPHVCFTSFIMRLLIHPFI